MEQPTPENALSVQHKAWLNHPCTIQMFQVLEKQKQFYLARGEQQVWDNEMDQYTVRNMIATTVTNTTITVLKNTEQFLNQLVK